MSIPPTYQLLENDTYQAAIQSLQQGDRVALQNLINRDPLVARKVLIKLLRQPDKLEEARPFAELFLESCTLELEQAFFDFFRASAPETRKKLLDSMEIITEAEYAIQHVQRIDSFEDFIKDQALNHLHQAAVEFQAMGFIDGEAYSLIRWTIYRIPVPDVREIQSRVETLEKARTLYEKSANLRGQVFCLVQLAQLNYLALQEKNNAAQLFMLAYEKGKIEGTPILGNFLSQYSWLAGKTSLDWLNESKRQLENQPGLRSTRYRMLT